MNMNRKFKVGDTVIVNNWGNLYTTNTAAAKSLGLKNWKSGGKVVNNDADWENHRVKVKIVGIYKNYVGITYKKQDYVIGKQGLEFVERGRPIKQPKVNFLLKYDLDEDPIEEFTTLAQIKKRIRELVKEEDSLKRDSIVVYEVKKKMVVELIDQVKIKGI